MREGDSGKSAQSGDDGNHTEFVHVILLFMLMTAVNLAIDNPPRGAASTVVTQTAPGSGFPFVSGRNGATANPRMKNNPMIVAAGP